MPTDMIDVSVYLYPTVDDAKAGEKAGGSGFLVRVDHPDPFWKRVGTVYAVTNSHIVSEAGSSVLRVNTRDGGLDVIAVPSEAWVPHPDGDDLAVAPITIAASAHRHKAVDARSALVKREESAWYAVGSDTAMVGRFVNHEGKQRNLPTVRFGHVAMLPWEPVKPDGGRLPQESFLVEEHSIGGYSGSPVFVYHVFPEHTVQLSDFDPATIEAPPFAYGMVVKLLGINWGHIRDKGPVLEANGSKASDNTHVELRTGMATVLPAWKLHELLFECEEVVQMREQAEREWINQHKDEAPAAALDAVGNEEQEFGRFEELTRRIIHVPKEEIDEKRKGQS